MPNFDVRDAFGSVITIESSVVGGANRQIVSANISLGNTSVSGTVGTSIIGQLPAGTAVLGSVATLQGTSPWITRGSISGQIDVSMVGMLPAGTQVIGSVATLQGTNPWITTFSNSSIFATQQGTQISSIVNSIPSSLLTGVYGHRNDAVASFLGGNLTWNPIATDSAGRPLVRPYAAEESRIEGYASTVNLNANSIIAAAGTGLRNYITDVWVANTGAAATLVTFLSGGGISVLGYTIAPAGSGSNLPGLVMPMRTDANATFDFRAATGTSVLYITAKGFKAP